MIETWVDLLAVVDGQFVECELRQESKVARASAASNVEHYETDDHAAGCDELVDGTVQTTATITSLNGRVVAEISTASDKK
jgi:hypothetical protein